MPTYVSPASIATPPGAYSHAGIVETGRMAFIAGQVGYDADGQLPGDVYSQTLEVFANIERIVTELGATPQAIVKFTTFFADSVDFEEYARARSEVWQRWYSGRDQFPAHSAIFVTRLVNPAFLVESECVVELPPR